MHDRNNKPLKVGDKITLLAVITDLSPSEDYCNVSLESVYGRRPDGHKEHVSAVNTGVLDKVEEESVTTASETKSPRRF